MPVTKIGLLAKSGLLQHGLDLLLHRFGGNASRWRTLIGVF